MKLHAHLVAIALVAMLAAYALVDLERPLVTGDDAPTSSGTATSSLTGATIALGMQAYEPTLAITPAGNLFYVGGRPGSTTPPLYVTGVPGEMYIHGSYDDGATWTNVTPVGEDGEIIDPFLTVDPLTGRLFRASYEAASVGGHGCLDLVWSDDEGASWARNPMACGIPPAMHDHESLATGVPRTDLLPMRGYPNVLYVCVNQLHGTGCTSSRDGGLSFGPTVTVFESVGVPYGWCGGLNGPVVTDSGGRVFLPRMHCEVAKVAVSEDDGRTWARYTIDTEHPPMASTLLSLGPADIPYIDTQDVMVEVDETNNLHAAWVAADGMVWVSSSQDHGQTWRDAWRLDVPGITAVAPSQFSLAAGASGKLAFTFAATDHPGGYAGNPTPGDWDGAAWHLFIATTQDAFAAAPVVDAVRVTEVDDPIGVDDCGLHRCTPCEAQDCGGWFDYLDVDLDADGRPWVAFVDVCHELCWETGELDRAEATVATLAAGPSLRGAAGPLPALSWVP